MENLWIFGCAIGLGFPTWTGLIRRRKGRSFLLGFVVHVVLIVVVTNVVSPVLLSLSLAWSYVSAVLVLLTVFGPVFMAYRAKPIIKNIDSMTPLEALIEAKRCLSMGETRFFKNYCRKVIDQEPESREAIVAQAMLAGTPPRESEADLWEAISEATQSRQ